jgi:hypothetical protein
MMRDWICTYVLPSPLVGRAVREWRASMSGTIELVMPARIEDATIRLLDERAHVFATRPRRGCAARRIVLTRVDAASEQLLEPLVDAWTSKRSLYERVETEGRRMALVEHDWMALRNRPVVIRLVGDETEKRGIDRAFGGTTR